MELLYKLNEKFSGNSKIISRLARTLCNQVISEHEKGRDYLKHAITLFKKENNFTQLQSLIIFYFYNLLSQNQIELLKVEMKSYEKDLIHDADYFRLMAHYSFAKNSHIGEAIEYFEKAIDISQGLLDKREFAESLLRFLSEQNSTLYKKFILKYEELL